MFKEDAAAMSPATGAMSPSTGGILGGDELVSESGIMNQNAMFDDHKCETAERESHVIIRITKRGF